MGHTVYAYDASGQRVAQATLARPGAGVGGADLPGTASAYVGSGQVDDPNTAATATGDLSATRYYTFAGSTVAIRTNDNKLALMLGDEQGSTSVMMPVTVQASGALAPATLADAGAVTRTAYTPYGQLRGADNLATDRGWLGQVEDRVDGATGTGLTYLNARYYDPATSRFISPDPLMNPGDPRTLDPYRYADNNPVVFTDATGLAACYGLSPANELKCLSAYNAGSGYTPPTPGPHTPAPAKPKPAPTPAPTSGGVPTEIQGVRVSDLIPEDMRSILARYPGRDSLLVGYVYAVNQLKANARMAKDSNSKKTINNDFKVAMWDWVDRIHIDSELSLELDVFFAANNHAEYGGAVGESPSRAAEFMVNNSIDVAQAFAEVYLNYRSAGGELSLLFSGKSTQIGYTAARFGPDATLGDLALDVYTSGGGEFVDLLVDEAQGDNYNDMDWNWYEPAY